MRVHSPLDPRAEVGQEGMVELILWELNPCMQRFECGRSLRDGFFFAMGFFDAIGLFFYVTCFVPAALRERRFFEGFVFGEIF
jgi:hypothetical protein